MAYKLAGAGYPVLQLLFSHAAENHIPCKTARQAM
jgi:hypothetical protein